MKATRKPSSRKRSRRVLRPASTTALISPAARGRGSRQEQRLPEKWQRHFRQLLRLRDELRTTSGGLMRQAAEPIPQFSLHVADAASDDFEHDLALGELSHEQNALYEVEEALRRIERGTYGICEVTGRPIPSARLRAVPWTRFTAEAGARLEKNGVVDRAKLGTLRSVQEEETAARLAETPEEEAEEDAGTGAAPEEQLWPVQTPGLAEAHERGRPGDRNKNK